MICLVRVTRNTHVLYESLISSGLKVTGKVKIIQKKVKVQGQGHKVKHYGIIRKVLSQGMYMYNINSPTRIVFWLWQRLYYSFRSRTNADGHDRAMTKATQIYVPARLKILWFKIFLQSVIIHG